MTAIKNISSPSENTCKCGSWLNHWEQMSGHTAMFCAERKCIHKDLVITHVQLANSKNEKGYIIPLCKQHSETTDELEVLTVLVAANPLRSCEKSTYFETLKFWKTLPLNNLISFEKIRKLAAIIQTNGDKIYHGRKLSPR